MLSLIIRRVQAAPGVNAVVVATSTAESDDPVERLCALEQVQCSRGSEADVLDRYHQAALSVNAETIIRITGDCPLISPSVVGRVVTLHSQSGADYATNSMRGEWPDGLDTEVFTMETLETAWKQAAKPFEREHVTPYIKNCGQFSIAELPGDVPASGRLRWTVDEPVDLELVRRIYAQFSPRIDFEFAEVLHYVESDSELTSLNSNILMNEGYYKSLYDQADGQKARPKSQVESQKWLARARKVIPGTAQTFSKSTSQYVQGVSPVLLKRGKGCRVWDVDGNEYVDYVQGLLPNILGYAHPEVNAAAAQQYDEGHSFSLPHPLEVELAERLCSMVPCAERIRFGKNGSDATAGAVRAARAFTDRERVACCGYHGWQDWYIGTTTRNKGVPKAVQQLTHPFTYNDLGSLEALLKAHPGEFGAVIMEAVNYTMPEPGFLEGVKRLAHEHGALLIFDEICTGFHLGLGGAQKRFGVIPDLACFGKAMGNGFPISCIAGRADVMAIFEDIFVSFTFGGEVASMAASMKVLDILEQTDALARIGSQGKKLQDGFNALSKQAGLADRLQCVGFPEWSLIKFPDFTVRSLWQQEVVKRGILQLVTHNMTAAHDDAAVQQTLEAYAETFKCLSSWLQDSHPERFLDGPAIAPVFKVR